MPSPAEKIAAIIQADPASRLALDVVQTLRSAGFTALLAGGCVRDALIGRAPKDYDVATDAHPDEVLKVFGHRRALGVGAAFGVICIHDHHPQHHQHVEVATFRSDGPYTDGRRPDHVRYSSPEEDAARRDFTINGLFFDPLAGTLIDFVGGCDDLENSQIRAIGDPFLRFHEDKLRLLRAIRFASCYDFEIEAKTWEAIVSLAAGVTVCSGERIGAEMRRLLTDPHADRGVRLLCTSRLAAAIMPAVAASLEDEMTFLRLSQRLSGIGCRDFPPRLASLALATGQAAPLTIDQLSVLWRLSNEESEAAHVAIRDLPILLQADLLPWSQLQPRLIDRYVQTSIALLRGTILAEGTSPAPLERIEHALALPPEQLNPAPLVRGSDLIALGLQPGPRFKALLAELRSLQLDGRLNCVEEALQHVRELRAS